MDKKKKDCGYRRPLRKYLIAALAGGLLGALIVGFYFMPPKDSGQLAAWVQAIGSILALAGVYWSTKRQAQIAISQAREKAKIEKSIKLEEVAVKVEVISDLIQRLQGIVEKDMDAPHVNMGEFQIKVALDFSEDRHLIKPFAESLMPTDSSIIGSKEIAINLVRLDLYLRSLEGYLSAVQAGPYGNPDLRKNLEALPEDKRIERAKSIAKMLNNNLLRHLRLIQNTCDELKGYSKALS